MQRGREGSQGREGRRRRGGIGPDTIREQINTPEMPEATGRLKFSGSGDSGSGFVVFVVERENSFPSGFPRVSGLSGSDYFPEILNGSWEVDYILELSVI